MHSGRLVTLPITRAKIRGRVSVVMLCWALWSGCQNAADRAKPKPRRVTELAPATVSALIPAASPLEWSQAILSALKHIKRPATRESVCAVIAVIAQESNFKANPAVPNLAQVVKARLTAYEEKYGRPGKALMGSFLDARSAKDKKTFAQRLKTVRTERDLDLTFRDMLAYHKSTHPFVFTAANVAGRVFDGRTLEELNPIATAGSMQVSVAFAETWADDHGIAEATARDSLYTIAGGVLYGTARLFDHEAAYGEMIYRFADYNGGLYASRNAAFQIQLARLLGQPLTPDGDLLQYDEDGDSSSNESQTYVALKQFARRFATDLSPWRIRRDIELEKKRTFEQTDTYKAVKAVFGKKFKSSPRYAVLPQAEIDSPKLRRKRSTVTYAQAAQRQYDACLGNEQ